MAIYYMIKEGTETYKKISEINKKRVEIFQKISKVANELGAIGWVCSGTSFYGKVIAFTFKEDKIPQTWIRKEYGYFPKLNTKEGKKFKSQLEQIGYIKTEEYNEIFNFNPWQDKYYTLGFAVSKEKEFCISVSEYCKFEKNYDMIEILPSEYKMKFKVGDQ